MTVLIAILLFIVQGRDPNTFSNYEQIAVTHLHLEWLLDLDLKHINATSEYTFQVKEPTNIIHLDIYQLDIQYVYLTNGHILKHYVQNMGKQSLKQGDQLQIFLDRQYIQGENVNLRIRYSVTQKARALSFMNAEQTESKVLPYLYSYCQDNNCRSMIPLQDTPSIKQLFSAVVLTKDERIKVFMTGNKLKNNPFKLINSYDASFTEYHFSLDLKIPSYLIAIVAGNLEERKVGDKETSRSYVICEPTSIEKVAKELEFLQDYVNQLSAYIGTYDWGDYKIVILPPSFPLGGMEHPLLTFASPTIIVGDKSGVGTAVHEIAHSWVGNTVTCSDWQNMWINEGFCTFLERKILTAMNGEQSVKIDAFLGNQTTFKTMEQFGFNHSFSSLHPNTLNENPDDSVSNVPYDKGYQLLKYIESLMGETKFQQMLRSYIVYFKWQSINEDDFYQYLLKWITINMGNEGNAITKEIIDIYKVWVYQGGLPPRTLDFHSQAYDDAVKLAEDWIKSKGVAPPANANNFNGWKYNQKALMLSELFTGADEIVEATLDLLEQQYQLSDLADSRLKYRWFILCLQCKYYKNQDKTKLFMGTHGAKSWLMRMYSTLNLDKPTVAKEWLNEFKGFYHPSVVDALKEIIKIDTQEYE